MRRKSMPPFTIIAALLVLAGCGRDGDRATRTPVPTWTPTVAGAVVAAPIAAATPVNQASAPLQAVATPVPLPAPNKPAPNTPEPPTSTLAPPTNTSTAVPTVAPTSTPTPLPTEPPTETPTPIPTATPSYAFELEAAERFPTESLAPNVVRIWLYAYSPAELGLADYSLRVAHNGAPLAVGEVSTAGVPTQTRSTPGPYTRFTNMNLLFVEPQAGSWEIQLVDASGAAIGPPALFELSADEITRELYVRYKQVSQ